MNTVLSKRGVHKILSWHTSEYFLLYLNTKTESGKTNSEDELYNGGNNTTYQQLYEVNVLLLTTFSSFLMHISIFYYSLVPINNGWDTSNGMHTTVLETITYIIISFSNHVTVTLVCQAILILHDTKVGNITSYLQAIATFPSINITSPKYFEITQLRRSHIGEQNQLNLD